MLNLKYDKQPLDDWQSISGAYPSILTIVIMIFRVVMNIGNNDVVSEGALGLRNSGTSIGGLVAKAGDNCVGVRHIVADSGSDYACV